MRKGRPSCSNIGLGGSLSDVEGSFERPFPTVTLGSSADPFDEKARIGSLEQVHALSFNYLARVILTKAAESYIEFLESEQTKNLVSKMAAYPFFVQIIPGPTYRKGRNDSILCCMIAMCNFTYVRRANVTKSCACPSTVT